VVELVRDVLHRAFGVEATPSKRWGTACANSSLLPYPGTLTLIRGKILAPQKRMARSRPGAASTPVPQSLTRARPRHSTTMLIALCDESHESELGAVR
jgi:hypothetical protein